MGEVTKTLAMNPSQQTVLVEGRRLTPLEKKNIEAWSNLETLTMAVLVMAAICFWFYGLIFAIIANTAITFADLLAVTMTITVASIIAMALLLAINVNAMSMDVLMVAVL